MLPPHLPQEYDRYLSLCRYLTKYRVPSHRYMYLATGRFLPCADVSLHNARLLTEQIPIARVGMPNAMQANFGNLMTVFVYIYPAYV